MNRTDVKPMARTTQSVAEQITLSYCAEAGAESRNDGNRDAEET